MQKVRPIIVIAALLSLQEVESYSIPSFSIKTSPTIKQPIVDYSTKSFCNLSNERRKSSLSQINTLLHVASSTTSEFATSAAFNEANDQTKINQDEKNDVIPSSATALSKKEMIRQQGGPFSVSTKYGGLNLFSLWYGFVAIALGIPWYALLTTYQLIQKLTGNRFDRDRKIPTLLNHVWGISLLRLTFCYPNIINRHILTKFYNE